MEESFFVDDDKTTPLLHGYELLQDLADDETSPTRLGNGGSWPWSSEDSSIHDDDEHGWQAGVRSLLPPAGNNGHDQSAENALGDIYRYYWLRGMWKFVASEVGHMVTMTWLVVFCIFLGTCVDYRAIGAFDGGGHTYNSTLPTLPSETSVWRYMHFYYATPRVMSWFFVLTLMLYGIYGTWRLFKFFRDLRRLVRVRVFYRDVMMLSDFNLRTARWADVLERLSQVHPNGFEILRIRDVHRMQRLCQSTRLVFEMISKREDAFKRLLETSLVDFVINIPVSKLRNTFDDIEFSMLTRGLQWNLMHCVVNFFFDSDMRLTTRDPNGQTTISRLKKRIIVLAVVNLILLPFLVVFVALYAIFRYGEQFYKDPSSVGARQWSPAARWYFRDYHEMPHVFEERLRLSSRFAKHYTKQFAAGATEGLARAVAFIIGSIVVWLLTLSLINEHVLLSLDISPGKSVLWWITVLSGAWVVCRSLLQAQHVFYPRDALQTVKELVRHLPSHFMENPGGRNTLRHFNHLFPLRVLLLIQEFAGLLVTPWILLRRVYPNAERIVQVYQDNTRYDELRGHYLSTNHIEEAQTPEEEDLVVDFDERTVLQSIHLVPYLQNLDTAMLRVDESI